MPPKTNQFLGKTQASAWTERWPWVLLWFWRGLLRLIIPIPTAQHPFPARKLLRVFAFWELRFAQPSQFWRSVAQILVQPNVVVEKRELVDGLLQTGFAVDLDLLNCSFEGAEESLDATIAPRRMRRGALMPNAQTPHCDSEIERNEGAVIVSAQRFWLSKRFNQLRQYAQNRFCTSVRETQRQKFAAAVVHHAQQRVGFAANRKLRPIQRPGLIGFTGLRRLPKFSAQLQDLKARFFAQAKRRGRDGLRFSQPQDRTAQSATASERATLLKKLIQVNTKSLFGRSMQGVNGRRHFGDSPVPTPPSRRRHCA